MPRLDAASISYTSGDAFWFISWQFSQVLQGSPLSVFKQFSALVNILAALVFPTPRDPANKRHVQLCRKQQRFAKFVLQFPVQLDHQSSLVVVFLPVLNKTLLGSCFKRRGWGIRHISKILVLLPLGSDTVRNHWLRTPSHMKTFLKTIILHEFQKHTKY